MTHKAWDKRIEGVFYLSPAAVEMDFRWRPIKCQADTVGLADRSEVKARWDQVSCPDCLKLRKVRPSPGK